MRDDDQKQMGRRGEPSLPYVDEAADAAADAATGLPGLRTWRAVYFAVGGVFVLWVALLTALTRFFSL